MCARSTALGSNNIYVCNDLKKMFSTHYPLYNRSAFNVLQSTVKKTNRSRKFSSIIAFSFTINYSVSIFKAKDNPAGKELGIQSQHAQGKAIK